MSDYYRILQVPETAGAEEIKRAYRRLARQYHPDATGEADASRFHELKRAYDTLSDEVARGRYDGLRAVRPAPRPMRGIDWLGDDITVDFPSLSAVVDRIRDAFLASDEPAFPGLRAEILLSRREAAFGTDVHLRVPLSRTCRGCGGRGETWMEPCPSCAGRGEIPVPQDVLLTIPAGVGHGSRFRFSVAAPYEPPTTVEVLVVIR